MSNVTKVSLTAVIIGSSLWLSGCGLFGGDENKSQIDPPKDVSLVEDEQALDEKSEESAAKKEGKEEASEETVKTELYLIDKNGYVVPQTLDLPKSEAVAKQALDYLVENGPVSNILPNGFRAVIPADTQISVNIKDGTAVADFSPEFKNYKKEDEQKILQSITWTLTQFDAVEKVQLRLNGEDMAEMPVGGTPISENMTRTSGINIDTSDVADITNTKALTVYFLGGEEGNYYYVPVTRRVSQTDENNVTAAVEELVKGPSHSSQLQTGFMSDVALLTEPEVSEGKVTLNFNESLLGSFKEKKVSQDVLDALVLSLTEQEGIESVEVQVDGSAKLLNEDGKNLSEPVSRPEKVNTGSY
ncbi:GerMN domain-containing protein [Bacillus massiliglaciei]|uniref:GerMN domain-containing protein n=1 Tax=Bacillus massiliglaciei TaxID=1816693 RepID=UPI000DA5F848|nr:GerMN domain-containing protein [Bacillus massiliglaciei]